MRSHGDGRLYMGMVLIVEDFEVLEAEGKEVGDVGIEPDARQRMGGARELQVRLL